MATLAVRVEGTGGFRTSIRGRDDLVTGLMLVFVVAEVLLGRGSSLVRAVRRRRAPDQLERHDEQQECEHPTTHDCDFRLAVSCPAHGTGGTNGDIFRFSIGCCFELV